MTPRFEITEQERVVLLDEADRFVYTVRGDPYYGMVTQHVTRERRPLCGTRVRSLTPDRRRVIPTAQLCGRCLASIKKILREET